MIGLRRAGFFFALRVPAGPFFFGFEVFFMA